jgi:hypothetical protein
MLKLKPGTQTNQSSIKAHIPKPHPENLEPKQELKPNIPSGKNSTSEVRKTS